MANNKLSLHNDIKKNRKLYIPKGIFYKNSIIRYILGI